MSLFRMENSIILSNIDGILNIADEIVKYLGCTYAHGRHVLTRQRIAGTAADSRNSVMPISNNRGATIRKDG